MIQPFLQVKAVKNVDVEMIGVDNQVNNTQPSEEAPIEAHSFFEQAQVKLDQVPVGPGVPLGITSVTNPKVGIGGAYGTWGESYDNQTLSVFLEQRLGRSLSEAEKMDLTPLGFLYRHHLTSLSPEEHYQLELEVGARFLREAAHASGWEPGEVDAVLVGVSGPVVEDYTEQIARKAGIPENALKVSVHKACDSSASALHMVLNPELSENNRTGINLARELLGKKVLVGGIEGLSRLLDLSKDVNALQLFGNGAGVIGVIPGKTLKFLVGKEQEVFDEKGLLAVHMFYPHSTPVEGQSLVDVCQENPHHLRVAGMMHEPENGMAIEMAGLMGMVKLFVRNGVECVRDVYQRYQELMREWGTLEKRIRVTIVHHANFKINKLKASQLAKEGVHLNMPWVLSEFGNVSAASVMIAFLRQLPSLVPGDHILIDGFGAGSYYDVFAVAMGGLGA